MNILVTGGLGFIGSHTVCELLDNNYKVVIIDNLSNSKLDVLDKIKKITGKDVIFYQGNVEDKTLLDKVFKENKLDAVIHFAGLKAVGESTKKPILYYETNLGSTLNLLDTMNKFNCKKIIFSSSATVYGSQEVLPIKETASVGGTTNPYGTTKLMIERILNDVYASDNSWSITILRYFNPIGAHKSGLIGENPNGIPNNLMPYIIKVAMGELPCLSVFGNDYKTKDGTGVRDYIHVVDLAKGHIKALEHLNNKQVNVYNLGTGIGYSVLDIVNTFEKVNNIKVNHKIVERRPGDIDAVYSDASKAYAELGWKAELDLKKMCEDSYNFAIKNK